MDFADWFLSIVIVGLIALGGVILINESNDKSECESKEGVYYKSKCWKSDVFVY